jgi:DNA-binding LacI/PurR family transcriptional regulator
MNSNSRYDIYLPKYIQVKKAINEQITQGIYKEGDKLASQAELAREFKTTKATLTKAILELVDENVLETRAGVGTFVPNRRTIEIKNLKIQAIIRDPSDPYQAKFVSTFTSASFYFGLNSNFHVCGFDKDHEINLLKQFLNDKENYIFTYGFLSDTARKIIKENGHRFFVFGPAPEMEGYTNVITTDFKKGMSKAVDMLTGLGHERIAYVGNLSEAPYSRYQGYLNGLRKNKIKIDEQIIFKIDKFSQKNKNKQDSQIKKNVNKILKLSAQPTAIICHNDHIAMHLLTALFQKGIKIPDDISLCSFGGALDGLTGNLRVTAIKQPLETFFKTAIQQILSQKNSNRSYIRIEPEIIYGNTVKQKGNTNEK